MVTFRHTVDLTWRRVCRPTRKTYVVPTATTQQCRGVTMNTCVTDCRYFRRHCSLFSRTGAGFSQVSVESSCRQYLIGSLIRTFLNTYLTTCQRYWCILCRCEHDNVYNLLYLNNWISLKLCHEIPVWEAFMILIRRDMAFYVLHDLIPCPDSSAIKRTVAWFIFNNNHFTSLGKHRLLLTFGDTRVCGIWRSCCGRPSRISNWPTSAWRRSTPLFVTDASVLTPRLPYTPAVASRKKKLFYSKHRM